MSSNQKVKSPNTAFFVIFGIKQTNKIEVQDSLEEIFCLQFHIMLVFIYKFYFKIFIFILTYYMYMYLLKNLQIHINLIFT